MTTIQQAQTHHDAFISGHAAQLHGLARDAWNTHGLGFLVIRSDGQNHRVGYLTQAQHQRNVADGTCPDGAAEIAGGLLARYTDPERAFPTVMEHDDGTVTGCMVQAVPSRPEKRPRT
jgi:hypothetical protein